MPNYRKPAKELVYDLINAENPQLPKPLSASNAILGTPVVIPNVSYPTANTKIQISARGNDFVGKQTVNYRRLDLASIFRGMVVTIPKYRDVSGLASSSTVFTLYQLLEDINTRYGLFLTEDDLTDAAFARGSSMENGKYTSTRTISAKTTSLGFTGSFNVKWINTNQRLDDLITVPSLDGRQYPGGNDFAGGTHKKVLTTATYGLDGDAVLAALGVWQSNASNIRVGPSYPGTTAWLNSLFGYMNSQLGTTFATDLTDAEALALFGGVTSIANTTLPSTQYPEANSVDFNRLMTFDVPETLQDRFGVGRAYFHFNI